jgi:hypothetical protein
VVGIYQEVERVEPLSDEQFDALVWQRPVVAAGH